MLQIQANLLKLVLSAKFWKGSLKQTFSNTCKQLPSYVMLSMVSHQGVRVKAEELISGMADQNEPVDDVN